jgi:hypothetical protein
MIVRVVPNPPAQRLGLVALRYPNGRIREESLAVLEGLRPGDQFDLYGRRWQAIGPAPLRRYERDSGRILCTPTGHTAGSGLAVPPAAPVYEADSAANAI